MPSIAGNGWEIEYSPELLMWIPRSGDGVALKMVREAFPPEKVKEYESISVAEDSRTLGSLHDDVVSFLRKWGLDASVRNPEDLFSEDPPD